MVDPNSSGIRDSEESVDDAPFSIDLTGRHPRFRIYAEGQKNGEDQLLPMTPDFAEFILATPEPEREGLVFPLGLSLKRGGRNVSAIGKQAGVVVNKAEGKFASAHDYRRAFGTRWAPRVKPATLKLLMRHSSIETTMNYYVDQDADEVADTLWAIHTSVHTSPDETDAEKADEHGRTTKPVENNGF